MCNENIFIFIKYFQVKTSESSFSESNPLGMYGFIGGLVLTEGSDSGDGACAY